MPLEFTKTTVTLSGACSVEEALPLLEHLQSHRSVRVDMGTCTHMHTAILQVLLAVRPKIAALPQDEFLAVWLSQTLGNPRGKRAR